MKKRYLLSFLTLMLVLAPMSAYAGGISIDQIQPKTPIVDLPLPTIPVTDPSLPELPNIDPSLPTLPKFDPTKPETPISDPLPAITQIELTLRIGETAKLEAKVNPSTATNGKVLWMSSDPNVASVDGDGNLTAVAVGSSIVRAFEDHGSTFVKYAVFVRPSDITGHWAETNIKQAIIDEFVRGYPDGTFRPDNTVTRAEFAVMLMGSIRPIGEIEAYPMPSFADKDEIPSWANLAIAQAVSFDIVKGYPDGTFRPSANITHAEMMVMIMRASELPMMKPSATLFKDDADIPDWARAAAATAEKNGISFLDPNHATLFEPGKLSSRAEAVTGALQVESKY